MTYVRSRFEHPSATPNSLGYSLRDYEGSLSTLCAGCGHDSISAAIVRACYELSIEPHRVAKLSGIGCSSKTPTYFQVSSLIRQLRASSYLLQHVPQLLFELFRHLLC